MENTSDQAHGLLRQPSSQLSEYSLNSNSTLVDSPTSTFLHQRGHPQANSVTEEDREAGTAHHDDLDPNIRVQGLGISDLDNHKGFSISRTIVGGGPATPGSVNLLLSPMSAEVGGDSYTSVKDDDFYDGQDENFRSVSRSSSHQVFTANSDRDPLHKSFPSSEANDECRMKRRPESRRSKYLGSSILAILSLYSTVASGTSLLAAIRKTAYGTGIPISSHFAAFAKSIELSFVTVFVAVVGQILSKRALSQPKGITIAEMSMGSWVIQPGTLFSRWGSVRYAGATRLGVLALLGTFMTTVYTTASDSLVTPVLKFGKTEHRLVYGKVSTSFANPYYIMDHCSTPIPKTTDPDNYGTTCIQIEHSGQAYHNYMQYLSTWVDNLSSGNTSNNIAQRPDPVGMLYDNTTLKGSWTNIQDMSSLSERYGRIVNNVTMVMPHAGVVAAAMDPLNDIVQPSDLSGLGTYYVQASVPSPVVNVLCANVSRSDMAPMVFTEWPSAHLKGTSPNVTNWPDIFNLTTPSPLVHTAVDDLFGFDDVETHPIFSNFPEPYNTVLNISRDYSHQSIYLLATSATGTYTMCSMRAAQSPDCFTEYYASMSGGSLTSHCGDNPLAYKSSKPEAPNGVWEKDWVNVASEWGLGLSLNSGITDGRSAISRLLTQLIPTANALDPDLPSISEALAELVGCTLVLSSLGAPFIHYWNYTEVNSDMLINPQYQAFNATLRTQEYQSGGNRAWQGVFYIVLVVVFVTNVVCMGYLGYFAIRRSHVTDFIEPQTLFCLSMSSPRSAILDGGHGGSLKKEHWNSSWRIVPDKEGQHLYMENRDVRKEERQREMKKGPIGNLFREIGRKSTSQL